MTKMIPLNDAIQIVREGYNSFNSGKEAIIETLEYKATEIECYKSIEGRNKLKDDD